MAGNVDINARIVRFAWWTLATIVLALVIVIRIRLLGIPLERDEGEYAYAGQLILQGIAPYKLVYNMKFPGTYAAYAAIMSILGQTIPAIHLGLLLINAATIVLIFLLGRRLIDSTAGIAAAVSYAVLSLSPSVLGLAAHATNFVILPVLVGMLFLLNKQQMIVSQWLRFFVSGLFFGIAALMKQPGLLFVPFGIFFIFWDDPHNRFSPKRVLLQILIFLLGAVLPLGVTCLILWRAEVLDKFWFWTIDYAWQYGRLVSLAQAPRIFFQSAREIVFAGWTLWIFAATGALVGIWDKERRASALFLIVFLFFSALALCPGFYFRGHYFILVLPAVSLLIGLAMSKLSDAFANKSVLIRFVPLIVLVAVLSPPIVTDKKIFFEATPVEASGMIYPESPFRESVRIADYIRQHTQPNDAIAVLGSEPEIYFYSKRHSATGYIYTYALMEPQKYAHRMQEEMISEIERARPKYLVSVLMNDSWLFRPQSDQRLFTWANEYTAQNYDAAGFVNIRPTETDYFFGNIPPSVESLKNYILIYGPKP